MKKIIFFSLFILTFNVFPNFLDFDNIGNFAYVVDAQSFGMGNILLFSPQNPSSFNGTLIIVGTGLSNVNEERSRWIFDTYNNTVGKSVIARNSYQDFGYFGFILNFESDMFRFGFNSLPLIRTNYRFYDVNMDEFYVITSEQEIKKDISIYGYTPNVGIRYNIFKGGIAVSILNGNSNYYEKTITDTNEIERKYKGLTFGGGFNLNPEKFLEFGLYYNHDISVKSDSDSIVYPRKISCGIKYNPPNILPVTFLMQIDYEFWSKTKINGIEQDNYKDVIAFMAGVQHKLTSSLFARLGYLYKSHYSQNVPIGIFTTGIGWEYDKTCIDLGIGFENTNFEKSEIYYNEINTIFKLSVRRNL